MRSCQSFRVYSYLCTGQITEANPPDPGGGPGLGAGVRYISKMGQPQGSAFPRSKDATAMTRENKEGRPMRGHPQSLLSVSP